MKTRTALLLVLSSTLLSACSDMMTKQWLDPDKTFASLDQPEIDSVNQTLEKSAKDAMARGEYKRAGQFYGQLADSPKSKGDDKFRYKLGMAESARRAGEAELALELYNALLKDKPDDLDAMEGRGLCLMATGKAVDAGRVFADIVKRDNTRWHTLNALGILFVTKNMIPEAMAYYTEALKHSPDNPAILNNVGLSQAVDRDFNRSFASFEQAQRVSKSEVQRQQISLNAAMVYGISGDLETASDIAGKYLKGPALDNNLGLYAHLAKDDSLAKTYLNMALSDSQVFYERAWNNLDVVDQKKN